ncbi:MAG: prepilin-type N-terminal cleavage/methylation domain-containing protein [candidate division WOR-3 bacterium]|nr:prepilin-type N-terminal cleavage/methylation domain-containing protein [candidate division WOR-3 bacterium]MDW8113795.1 prepilin-type N-terminal cleavage/methylation domain-containing protein [candidate division WOR-3 bacterium]
MRKGFTLIEILIVILIIGILIALFLPHFSLFQERAKRTKVKSNMETIQKALIAWAQDHYGEFPMPEIVGEVLDPEGPLAYYFPGGEIEEDKIGEFPINPYTGLPYNSEYEDLFYGGKYVFKNYGENAKIWAGDTLCPYLKWADSIVLSGQIAVGVYFDTITYTVTQYGIAGWGECFAESLNYPIYEISPLVKDPLDKKYWKFYVLHN